MAPALRVVCLAALLGAVCADLYMHNPAGSNNRNREQNDNRANANRMFDSQNNGKGGYPWRGNRLANGEPTPITYYEGSKLRLEWTNQHSCGTNPNIHCQVVVQYACEDTMPELRDGYPTADTTTAYPAPANSFSYRNFAGTNGQNNQGTNRIPDTAAGAADVEFGMHENRDWYTNCKTRERNRGLYTADRELNRNDARSTRQNPSGTRYGFECPEERDYYPYWHPTPWRDVAVLVSDTKQCSYYQEQSQNVKDVGYCEMTDQQRQNTNNNLIPIEEAPCRAAGGTWSTRAALGGGAPDCLEAPLARDNHLGNAMPTTNPEGQNTEMPEASQYWWTIPTLPEGTDESLCVLRVRYNMSTNDYPSMASMSVSDELNGVQMYDQRFNCPAVNEAGRTDTDSDPDSPQAAGAPNSEEDCMINLEDRPRPLYNRPYVPTFGDTTTFESSLPRLSVALNTDQAGRTFQDRSYVFRISKRPATVPASATVWNLNTRGRRGNIVQCYPAVEYDFTPNELTVSQGDYLHVQWVGSDFNAAKNPNNAEGWQRSDRFNMVQVDERAHNIPIPAQHATMWGGNTTRALWFGLLGQKDGCDLTIRNGDNNENNDPGNCGKMNRAPAVFGGEVFAVSAAPGTYHYTSTRNNNFSNRSQKGTLVVKEGGGGGLSAGAAAAIALSVTAVVVGGVGVLAYKGIIRLPSPSSFKKASVRKSMDGVKVRRMSGTVSGADPSTRRAPPPPPPRPGSMGPAQDPLPPPRPAGNFAKGRAPPPPPPPSRPSTML